MRILHVISSLEIGGAERILSELLPLLKEKGETVSLLVCKKTDSIFEQTLLSFGIEIISLNLPTNHSPRIFIKLLKYSKQYDVIHVHLFPMLYWAAIVARICRNPFIYTEHSTNNRRRDRAFLKPIERFIYNSYKIIISISIQTQLNLKNWLSACGEDHRFVVIENGIKLNDFIMGTAPNEMSGIPPNSKILLMVSRFSASKDQKTVIRSIPLIEDSTVHLVFAGEGTTKDSCVNLTNSLGINNRVHFLGNRNDIPQLIANSYIGIQSSHWEGFGLTAVEFMAGMKPVIASNVDGLKQIVEGAGLLFEKGNEFELANSINRLIKDQEEYRRISKQCFQRAEKFNINNTADKYIQVYHKIGLKL
jgi:glycosyltransferase involved in cell wall biosynthesis